MDETEISLEEVTAVQCYSNTMQTLLNENVTAPTSYPVVNKDLSHTSFDVVSYITNTIHRYSSDTKLIHTVLIQCT